MKARDTHGDKQRALYETMLRDLLRQVSEAAFAFTAGKQHEFEAELVRARVTIGAALQAIEDERKRSAS